jgi:hypothetical protein
MGLKTVLAYESDSRAQLTKNAALDDPFSIWKAARRRVFHERALVFGALLVGFAVLLARAAEREADWVALALGVGMIPIATELTCYYYSVMLGFALLWARREEIGVATCVTSALTCLIPSLIWWDDVRFTVVSGVMVALVVAATAWMAIARRDEALRAAPH